MPNRGRIDHFIVQRLDGLGRRVAVELHFHRDIAETRIPLFQPEKRVKIEIAFDIDRKTIDRNPGSSGIGGVTDRKAIAECAKNLLDRIGACIRASKLMRLVGFRGSEFANFSL